MDGFSLSVRVPGSFENMFMEDARLRGNCDTDRRDWGGGASPKMKNLIKAPMRRTTESWPRRKPWVKDSLRHREWFGLRNR